MAVGGGGLLAEGVPRHPHAVLQVSLPQRARPGPHVAQCGVPLRSGSDRLPFQHQALLRDGEAGLTGATLNQSTFSLKLGLKAENLISRENNHRY